MAVPPALKGINQYILVAKQFATRDPVIAYFCELSPIVYIHVHMYIDQWLPHYVTVC